MRRRPGSVTGSSPSTGSPEAWASRWRSVAPGGPAGSSRSTVPSSSATRSTSPAPRPTTSRAGGSTSSTGPTGGRWGARRARCSPRFAPPRRCSSSPARSIPPGRSRSRPTPSYPNETRDSGGPVRRRRPLGTDRRAEVHPSPVHASRGARRRLCDRRRARARPARALLRRDAPRRRGQRAAPDRARLPLLGVLRRLHRAPRPLPSGGSGPGVRPRGRLDLAHRRRQPRGLHRLGDRGQPGRRTAARARPRRGAGRRLGRSECPDRQLRLPRARVRLVGTPLLRGPVGGEDRVVGRDRDSAGPARPTLSCCKSRRYRPSMSDSLIPPSITGKGSHFPPGGSVLDHAFGASDPYTLGVEEEYMLLDGETFDLVQHIDTVLAAVAGHELEPRINAELMQSVLEVATPVCHTPAGVPQPLLPIRP